MKKWFGLFISFLLMILIFLASSSFQNPRKSIGRGEESHLVANQYREEEKVEQKGEKDSHFISILKEIKEIVDGWLKSLNEKIEREDVTRFRVRFLEILRSILEWVKEKVDSKLKSLEEDMPEKEGKPSQDTYQRIFRLTGKG